MVSTRRGREEDDMTPGANNERPVTLGRPILSQGWSAMRQQKHRGTNGNGPSAGANGGGRRRKLRIALYSHDTMGIGHMRRNQLIAEAFAATAAKPNILLIC